MTSVDFTALKLRSFALFRNDSDESFELESPWTVGPLRDLSVFCEFREPHEPPRERQNGECAAIWPQAAGWLARYHALVGELVSEVVDVPMIVRAAEAGGFIRINDAFREASGFCADDLAGKPILDWINPDDHADVRSTLSGEKPSCRVGHRTKQGKWLPLTLRSSEGESGPVLLGRADDTEPSSTMGEVAPAVDETVRGNLHTIAHIVEDQNPGYRCSILLVADGRFVRGAGPSLPEAYNAAIDGFAIGPTVGSCGTAIYWGVPVIVTDIQADPLWVPFAELARDAGVGACWSHPFTDRDGSVLGALAFYAPGPEVPSEEQLSRLKAAARMTGLAVERGRAEEALLEQRKRELELEGQLRQAAKMEALGVLAGGVAHDFNNVLAGILANAELALDLIPGGGTIGELLGEIVEASVSAGGFCQQMLAYAGHGQLESAKLDMRSLVPQSRTIARAALSANTSLEFSLPDEAICVEGDPNQLLQVIMNLVTNAAEAIGDGEGTITVTLAAENYDRVSLDELAPDAELKAGEYVRLSVADDGDGMSDETLTRLFDPFYTTKRAGRGLGLAAVRGIVQGHGGFITTDSELGRGTCFTLGLPRCAGECVAQPPADDVAATESRQCILVIEDEKQLRSSLVRRLEHNGFDVIATANGAQGLEAFRADGARIDCVLVDLHMPKLNGVEVTGELRSIQPNTPIVIMSGYNDHGLLSRFDGDTPPPFLQKPVRAADLLAAIRDATAAPKS